jgi:hypothetical protein
VSYVFVSSTVNVKWNIFLADRALDTISEEIVALKKMRMENEKDGTFCFAEQFFATLD